MRHPRESRASSTQRTVSAPEGSSGRTDISEPVTDVTVMLDTPGRATRVAGARPRTAPTRVGSGSQTHSSATLSEPFVDADADANGSPVRRQSSMAQVFALNASPGMSEGLSVQYEDVPGPNVSGAGPSKTVKKWRLHFAKPPSAAEAMAVKPVPAALLAERLELDEETVSFFTLSLVFFWAAHLIRISRGVPSTSRSFYFRESVCV
jgi:hypothetical protein